MYKIIKQIFRFIQHQFKSRSTRRRQVTSAVSGHVAPPTLFFTKITQRQKTSTQNLASSLNFYAREAFRLLLIRHDDPGVAMIYG